VQHSFLHRDVVVCLLQYSFTHYAAASCRRLRRGELSRTWTTGRFAWSDTKSEWSCGCRSAKHLQQHLW